MIHLLFFLTSLALCAGSQYASLYGFRQSNWRLRYNLQLLALAMPILVWLLFGLTKIVEELFVVTHEPLNELSLVGFGVASSFIITSLVLQISRLIWLYVHSLRQSWQAPSGLNQLIPDFKVEIRLCYNPKPFAYNLPTLWPLKQPIIVLSTTLVAQLSQEQLQAVLWHEVAHLKRHDCWISWAATWWQIAFFYLPVSKKLLQTLRNEQELACDEQVAWKGMALTLAEALLCVWQETIQPTPSGFQAPNLTNANVSLTEQRVLHLIKLGKHHQPNPYSELKSNLLPLGITLLSLSLAELTHLLIINCWY